MSSYGIKISQPGFDAPTTGEENLTITSNLNSFKVFMTGTQTYTDGDTITINHNLGYTPGFLIYYDVDGTDKRFLGDVGSLTESLGVITFSRMFSDRLEVQFVGGTAETGTLRYYIFSDVVL